MSQLNLKNNPIWNSLSQLLAEIDCCEIAREHLKSCSQKIRGYWDSKNDFYEEVAFVNFPLIELVSSGIGMDRVEEQIIRWIKLRFLLKVDGDNESAIDDEIGELTLILDSNLKVVDENWSVDMESPFVVATKQKEKAIANF